MTLDEQRADFVNRLVLLKAEAMRIGMARTCHTLEAAVKEVGWELADIQTGDQPDWAKMQEARK